MGKENDFDWISGYLAAGDLGLHPDEFMSSVYLLTYRYIYRMCSALFVATYIDLLEQTNLR